VVAAARHEGWAGDAEETRAALTSGTIVLAPAQDHGLVTPLAFVVGPSMIGLEVDDAQTGQACVAPLNDGPPACGLRFGTGAEEGLAKLRAITDGIGADIGTRLATPLALLPLMHKALAQGDDLHSKLDTAQSELCSAISEPLPDDAAAYLEQANQFVLNVLMAAAAVMLAAGAGVSGSRMVVAAGGNGRAFGWKEARSPHDWIVRDAERPAGPRMPGKEAATPLPAIGDSAVLDAAGFGAACMRFAPAVAESIGPHVHPGFTRDTAHAPFIGPHPALPDGVKVGLDLSRPRECLGVVLGMVDEAGHEGLIGRGVAPWPAP
jgi:hypothetical protein